MLKSILACTLMVMGEGVETSFIESGATARTGGYRPIRAEMTEQAPESITTPPADLKAPKFGAIELGGKSWAFIVDQVAEGEQKLYVDANGDGDFTNDPAATWAPKEQNGLTMYNGSATVQLAEGRNGAINMYRFDPTDPRRAQLANTLLFYTDFGYEIKLKLDDQEFTTFVSGEPTETSRLWIDRDANGASSSNYEMISMGEAFNYTGTTYVLGMEEGSLSLSVAAESLDVMPMPPNLAVGQPVLPFEVKTLDGATLKFPDDYKGKIVLVDFWATWCGPCIAELPNVKAAYAEWHDEGFEVLGISFDNENMQEKLTEFITQNEMPWPQIYEGKGWNTNLGNQYDVSSIPFVLLVDGETGEILATREQLRGPGLKDFIGEIIKSRQ